MLVRQSSLQPFNLSTSLPHQPGQDLSPSAGANKVSSEMDSVGRNPISVILAAFLAALAAVSNAPSALAETSTQINFYLHDNLLTLEPSAYALTLPVLGPPLTSFFGSLVCFDDSMTTGPDPSSLEIARGRGMYLFDASDKKGAGIQFTWTAQFNGANGYSNGSTLSFEGFDRTTDPTREISISGGTGMFRLAKGWATITTYSLQGAAAVLDFTAYVTYG